MVLSKTKIVFKLICFAFILVAISVATMISACRKYEESEPEIEYLLQYRILYDESLSGNEIISRAEQYDYDIVFFNEDQLSEAGEKVKDIARNRLAVFIGLSLNRANKYLCSDRFGNPSGCDASASCYSVCKNSLAGETDICGDFQLPNQGKYELIEEMSKYWHERQMDLLAQETAAAQQ